MEKYLVNIHFSNYNEGSCDKSYSKRISKEQFNKFLPIFKIIKRHKEDVCWNWWEKLPEKWNGENYVPDTWAIDIEFKGYFKCEDDPEYKEISTYSIVKFFKIFTPNGADGIRDIKIYETKEVKF